MPDCPWIGGPAAGGHERPGAASFTGGDLIHCAAGGNRAVLGQQSVGVLAGELVAMLDEQQVVALAAVAVPALHAHEHPAAPELLAGHGELELALAERGTDVGGLLVRRPEAAIPEHNGATAVFALGNRPLEVAVVERMVLDLDRQSFVARIAGGPLGYRPGLEYPVVLEAQVVVQAGRCVLLDDETRVFGALDRGLAAQLGRPFEIAFGLIGGKLLLCHCWNSSAVGANCDRNRGCRTAQGPCVFRRMSAGANDTIRPRGRKKSCLSVARRPGPLC